MVNPKTFKKIGSKVTLKNVALTTGFGVVASDVFLDTKLTKKVGSTLGEVASGAGSAVGEGVGATASGIFGDWWPFIIGTGGILFLYFAYLILAPTAPTGQYRGGGSLTSGASNRTIIIAGCFIGLFAICQTLANKYSVNASINKT